jgi:hypothetical protein
VIVERGFVAVVVFEFWGGWGLVWIGRSFVGCGDGCRFNGGVSE